ncbi:uncharacterized protein LOC117176593 [Belonocnema kinseyi]|uniref:uncharacterized protein LOC117176593 n=1 Tax=Belonocnema kinseyi TaxID=2817044 RepID=UPI00143DE3F4|nr:uncharacterized protein LOC117176593 [Belonocnema kinseyi]
MDPNGLAIAGIVRRFNSRKGFLAKLQGWIVLQDLYTKCIELFAIRHRTSKFVVKALDEVFDHWGTPRYIVTDNGTEYINKDFRALLLARGVKHITTSLSHPQSNQVKRAIKFPENIDNPAAKDSIDEWIARMKKIDEFLYKIAIQIKKSSKKR